ncbi:MAG: c-type cytochrome [Deltaproteobacteria bacterium]|nr:MAG: c-type cytochrome [Deltaproteobacteria bacterium]TMB28633.1 MAG: c-type cytochrome [Deltaproteobacteria bacterium]TMB31338.1 MAG: c-type cytochrome [Deltaproteobacteria bacterium]
MNRTASLLAAALVFSCGCSRGAPQAPALSPGDEAAWNRVVAALQQVSEEYREALELKDPPVVERRLSQLATLLDEASALLARIGTPRAADVDAQVKGIRRRIAGIDYRLGEDTRAIVDRILQVIPVRRAPEKKPDLANGKRLFAEACAACHGADGTGPPPEVAKRFDPPPPDILHPDFNWSPYEMFNRLTYGGIETAMPSFEEGLSPQERWDIVFHLFAERWPPCTKPLPKLGSDRLAALGDFELGNEFGYGAASCLRRDFLAPGK